MILNAYENDNLTIPKKYRKMSVSELDRESEKIYKKIVAERAKNPKPVKKKTETCGIKFCI